MVCKCGCKNGPDFKPEEDLKQQVLLPGLSFHMHDWHYIKQLLSSVGTPLALEAATIGRTRPIIAKIRVEVDLLKPLPETIFVGQEYDDSPLKGYTQKLEYEGVPEYCKHCLKLGHYMAQGGGKGSYKCYQHQGENQQEKENQEEKWQKDVKEKERGDI